MCSAILNYTHDEQYGADHIGFRADRIAKLAAGYMQVAGSTCQALNV